MLPPYVLFRLLCPVRTLRVLNGQPIPMEMDGLQQQIQNRFRRIPENGSACIY